MSSFRTLIVSALAVVAPVTALAQPSSAADFDRYVAAAVRDWQVPGLAIAVVKDDSVVFARGYGVRDVGSDAAVDAGTRFAIGSTTKAMTAAALGMLADEGKVRWDEPVITYLPHFRLSDPWLTRQVTVRDLLIHRAGLGNADMLWTVGTYDRDEIIRRIRHLPLAYSPRSGFIYQNVMYAVAGEVVAAASGMSWEDFVRTRIFQPLGMRATEATLAGVEGQPNVAAPHDVIAGSLQVVPNRPVDPVAAAGSVWSSVDDMTKWMRFLLDSGRVGGRRLLSDSTFRELFRSQTIAPPTMYTTSAITRPRFFTYGLGWFLHDYDGEAVAMHTGSIDGMSAIVGLLPEHNLGVVVLANLDHAELRHALMYRAFDHYRGARAGGAYARTAERDWSTEFRQLYASVRARQDSVAEAQRRARVTGTRPSLPLERYAGTYTDSTFGDVVVTVDGGTLLVTAGNRRGTLEHWQYDTFRAQWSAVRASPSPIVFAPNGMGGVASLRLGNVTFARRPGR